MTRLLLFLLLPAALLMSCKNAATQEGAARTLSDPQITRAQASIDSKLSGRACTSLTKIRFVDSIESATPQFAKIAVLEKQGVLEVERTTAQGVQVTDARSIPRPGTDQWIEEPGRRYYCFGQWVVTSAEPSTEVDAPAGRDVLKIQYELRDAPDWLQDPAAEALAQPSGAGDLAYMLRLNELGNPVAASYRSPNVAYVAVPKPD